MTGRFGSQKTLRQAKDPMSRERGWGSLLGNGVGWGQLDLLGAIG